jgi:hypothetical protein
MKRRRRKSRKTRRRRMGRRGRKVRRRRRRRKIEKNLRRRGSGRKTKGRRVEVGEGGEGAWGGRERGALSGGGEGEQVGVPSSEILINELE